MLKLRTDLWLGEGWRLVMTVPCHLFPSGRTLIFKRKVATTATGHPLVAIAAYMPVIPLFPPEVAQAEAMRNGPTGFYLN